MREKPPVTWWVPYEQLSVIVERKNSLSTREESDSRNSSDLPLLFWECGGWEKKKSINYRERRRNLIKWSSRITMHREYKGDKWGWSGSWFHRTGAWCSASHLLFQTLATTKKPTVWEQSALLEYYSTMNSLSYVGLLFNGGDNISW